MLESTEAIKEKAKLLASSETLDQTKAMLAAAAPNSKLDASQMQEQAAAVTQSVGCQKQWHGELVNSHAPFSTLRNTLCHTVHRCCRHWRRFLRISRRCRQKRGPTCWRTWTCLSPPPQTSRSVWLPLRFVPLCFNNREVERQQLRMK